MFRRSWLCAFAAALVAISAVTANAAWGEVPSPDAALRQLIDPVEPVAFDRAPVGFSPIREALAEDRLALAEAGVTSLDQLSQPCAVGSDAPTTLYPMPIPEALESLSVVYPTTAACCKICTRGIACGNTCISARYTCHVGSGCACNAGDSGFVQPPVSTPTPESLRIPEVTLLSQSSYPRLRVGQSTELSLTTRWLHGPSWVDGDVGLYVSNESEAGVGLRGWDRDGLVARNRGAAPFAETQQFRLVVQAMAPGTYRLRVAFRHATVGSFGPTGIYWDIAVDPAPAGVQQLREGWHSRWVSQSPYLVMRAGDTAQFWIRFANVGTETWQRGVRDRQANLGLNGDDRWPYALGMAANWLWEDRIATTVSGAVAPGEIAEFRFSVRAPVRAGIYYLNLRPVIDGTTWLEDEGVFWIVEVR